MAEILSAKMRNRGGSAAFVSLLDRCGDPAEAARALAERVGWAQVLGSGRRTSMSAGNGRAAGFPSVQPDGGLSLYKLANKLTESRNEDGPLGSGQWH